MEKSIFGSSAVILIAASCLLFDAGVGVAKSSILPNATHPEYQSLKDSETLLDKRLPKALPRWVSRVPARSRGQWLDQSKGIYRSNRGSIIGPYGLLANDPRRHAWISWKLNGQKVEAHHLIEKRFARLFGMNENDMPAVLLTRAQHTRRIGSNGIHERINRFIRHGNRAGTRNYNAAQILRTYREVYRGQEDWIDTIGALLRP